MGRRRDAALAGLVGLAAGLVGLAVRAPVDPAALLAGAAASLGLELVLARRARLVRRLWTRPAVQAGALLAAFAGLAVVTLVGPRALWAVTGGAVAYLALLGVAALRRRRDGPKPWN